MLSVSARHRLSEAGDTIVEVLIAIGVMTMVMSGAFVTANRSLQGTREAEERQGGLKLAEAQLEQIKYLASTDPNALFGTSVPSSFCLVSNAVVTASDPQCRVSASGAASTADPAYQLVVSRSGNIFTARASWTNVRGTAQNVVELKYKVYDNA